MPTKTVELVRQSEGKRIVRMYAPYERYFIASAAQNGKQFQVQHILTCSQHGQDLHDLGIQNGWILTKIGYDQDTSNLMYCIIRNKICIIAKMAKTSGYVLTFEGIERKHKLSNAQISPIASHCHSPRRIQYECLNDTANTTAITAVCNLNNNNSVTTPSFSYSSPLSVGSPSLSVECKHELELDVHIVVPATANKKVIGAMWMMAQKEISSGKTPQIVSAAGYELSNVNDVDLNFRPKKKYKKTGVDFQQLLPVNLELVQSSESDGVDSDDCLCTVGAQLDTAE